MDHPLAIAGLGSIIIIIAFLLAFKTRKKKPPVDYEKEEVPF